MPKRKVLYFCHNHPEVRPGGAEAYALELHEAMRENPSWDSTFLARTGPPISKAARYHAATPINTFDGRTDEYLLYTDLKSWDHFLGTSRDKRIYTEHLRAFLRAFEPDVVHFQHTYFLGYDLIREVRNTLPGSAIVYTLHELLPICHRNGQMVRTGNDELCRKESPRRCHECFPNIAPREFFLRKQFTQAQFALVDQFLAPSRFLMDRYLEWGIQPEKIRFEDYGRTAAEPAASSATPTKNRLGYFGQLTPFKGAHVLLEAMKSLATDGSRARLTIHGANLELQPKEYQERLSELLEDTRDVVSMAGAYDRESLDALMGEIDWVVVPSVWWENSPLVIQEAFQRRRPVICSDIGGMAEKVIDGVNGLHFRVGDPRSLSAVVQRAVGTPGLWDQLQSEIPAIYPMNAHVSVLTALYDELLDQRRARTPTVSSRRTREAPYAV